MEHKAAFIAIVGSPNVGKSTLMNYIVGEKVAIVSSKPQTTRNRIAGILTGRDFQMIFLDTPGVHSPKNRLGEFMVKTAFDALRDVDAVLFMCDAKYGLGERDRGLLGQLVKGDLPVVAAVNKTDAAARTRSTEMAQQVISAGIDPLNVFQISAKTGEGVDELMMSLKRYLVPGPRYYPEDAYTDQPERMVAAEMIREKALNALKEEVPHGIGVSIDSIARREDKDIIDVSATIICERPGHKGIIIGKGGKMLRRIGSEARKDLEMLFGMKVFLKVWVKVEENWRDSARVMRSLGYE
ncbi:MAG: GTPase Era [Christensenellales bacterium]|jgi:GTP-binding protein Era